MAINRETTMVVPTYMKKVLVAKLEREAMRRSMNRNQLINLILDAYFLENEVDEAEEVKENEKN